MLQSLLDSVSSGILYSARSVRLISQRSNSFFKAVQDLNHLFNFIRCRRACFQFAQNIGDLIEGLIVFAMLGSLIHERKVCSHYSASWILLKVSFLDRVYSTTDVAVYCSKKVLDNTTSPCEETSACIIRYFLPWQ
ncbi:MAG: hypothetical protein A4E20_11825 [Nitrospira sp. SG-bin2]|nr:MAG: hypothetical protein A4E20_11825 [Nitrospira sp. SG-bin2]